MKKVRPKFKIGQRVEFDSPYGVEGTKTKGTVVHCFGHKAYDERGFAEIKDDGVVINPDDGRTVGLPDGVWVSASWSNVVAID